MTSLTLLLWITLGIAVQLAVLLGIAFWRHWQAYGALKTGAASRASLEATLGKAPTWTGYRAFKVARKDIEDGAATVCSFYLKPSDGKALPAFLPGQYLTFRLDLPTPGGREEIVRCYSLSDAPNPDSYRVSIKRVPAPPGSDVPPGRASSYFHDRVEVGSTLQIRAPSGHFHSDETDSPAVLIGGGIGITPLLSMLNWCMAKQPKREVWFFYGVRNSREVVMKAQLDALAAARPNFHLWRCFSAPLSEDRLGRDYRHSGRVGAPLLRQQLPLGLYHYYICGPAPMMQSLVSGLEDWGVPQANIHFEAFGPASIKRSSTLATAPALHAPEASDAGIVVNFIRSGKQLPWQPSAASLLEFAEANGIAVDSGCRAGACGTCQTTIQSGEVTYRHAPDFDPEPGTCLLCVCTPKTSVVLEA